MPARIQVLLGQMEADLAQGVVPLAIYNDPEIYALELERIFGRCWIFLAHESEIQQPGDYVLRYVGFDPWIVVRDEQGLIQVLFDSCRHRGTQLCRADTGNASHFRCPYHGWTYRNDGALVGVPNRSQAYKALDTEQWSLLRPPQVDSYRGLIFACLDASTPSLPEYLGDFRWYLDMHLGLTPGGMEVLGEPHRWLLDADWKSGAENFSGDSYHTQSLHRSIAEVGLAPQAPPLQFSARTEPHQHVTECGGHATSVRRAHDGEPGFWGYPPEVVQFFRKDGLSKEQFELASTTINTTGTIFPNLSLIHTSPTDDPHKPPAAYLSFRQWQPKGPGQMEIWSWVLAPKEASPAYKERAYKVAVASFSPSGNFEQDDTIVWHGIARSARSLFARKAGAKLNYQMGLESMSEARIVPDWPGPGVAYDSNLEEGVQRTFLRHWLREMSRG
ncbi:MAG TPA: aromatic ring-hydroxylating dioxygenase subunit alpha [Chloroflexota bacterium]|nr:aromatic ring-hydroxylating dioxygenase subunit alpha [Chloroflexota bacterium]